LQTQVLIIGAGITGAGLARDLALRGIASIVVDRGDFNSGASGSNHGLLHSGARYVAADPEAAAECRGESALLKKLAPHCVEDTGGLFVAVRGDDEQYVADFPGLCSGSGIEAQEVSPEKTRELEPALSGELEAAYLVPDGAVEPFRLCLDNMAQAEELGADFWPFAEVQDFEMNGERIAKVRLSVGGDGETRTVEPRMVVNAAGAWAGRVAALAGVSFRMLWSKGTMAVTASRQAQRVVNRLRHPSDADILVPGGHVSILGTTSVHVSDLGSIAPTVEEVDALVREGGRMMPGLENARYIRAYAGVRPVYASGGEQSGGERSAGRGFVLLDHGEEGVGNLLSLTGGKLTTYRLMAEKCADRICDRLNIDAECRTRREPLPRSEDGAPLEHRTAERLATDADGADDPLLCECEMVPRSEMIRVADTSARRNRKPDLPALRLRSRMGKGPCQGTFCSIRVPKYLFGEGDKRKQAEWVGDFLRERWKGVRPVLWGVQLAQAELTQGMHCGFFSLEAPWNRSGQ
jgi:glycerol-3-phosphate dehydrogenase